MPESLNNISIPNVDVALTLWSQNHNAPPPWLHPVFHRRLGISQGSLPLLRTCLTMLLTQLHILAFLLHQLLRLVHGSMLFHCPQLDSEWTITLCTLLQVSDSMPHYASHICATIVGHHLIICAIIVGHHGLSCRYSEGRHSQHAAPNDIICRSCFSKGPSSFGTTKYF